MGIEGMHLNVLQYTNRQLPGEADWSNMAQRLVCTANVSQRFTCGFDCSGCGRLIADRRTEQVRTIRWSLPDRRVMSNWLPVNHEHAGIGMSTPVSGGIGRDGVVSFPLLLMVLLVTFNLLDSVLTARALSMGFTEANPLLAGLFDMSLPMGMLIKSAVVGLGALALWQWRHLPVARRGMNVAAVCYGAVIMYHLYFQLIIG